MSEYSAIGQLKKIRTRSPNYPAIGLEKSIERSAIIYEQAKSHLIPLQAAFQIWGYKEAAGSQTVAALKSFGLIETAGEKESRKLRITEIGQMIIRNHPDRASLLKELALKPDIHKEIWEKYQGDLPVDSVIKNYLLFDRKFNEESVDSFIAQFRNTLLFANVVLSDKIPDKQEPLFDKGGETKTMEQQVNYNLGTGVTPPSPPPPVEHAPAPNESVLAFRISRDSRVRVIFSGEVTQEAIEKLRILLEHSKDTFPTKEETERPRPAIWHTKEADRPVVVVGNFGHGMDGRKYARIEGSDTGVPEDELEYTEGQ